MGEESWIANVGWILLLAVGSVVLVYELYEFVLAAYRYRLLQVILLLVFVVLLIWWVWDRWG
ncbi:MAG TPA: hypothetical protein VFZ44_11900 [Pyrinomonadaceae bacterium]